MLTVDDEAREYLFVLLDQIRELLPDGKCFRLVRAETGEAVLRLSDVSAADDVSELEGRTVLVWKSDQFPAAVACALEVGDDDQDDQVLILAETEGSGARTETVVKLDDAVHRFLAEVT
jgi:hypothetical protein